jgi:DNA-binding MarR family transcriptional regulator
MINGRIRSIEISSPGERSSYISNTNYLDSRANRMSRDELVAELGAEVRANQAAVDALDEAVAARLGVNRTDLRCLDLLLNELDAAATPGRLGARLGLSTGSVTAMVDRLVRLGYVTRTPDPADRRKVVVRPTDLAMTRAGELYGPLVAGGDTLLADYTAEQLRLLIDFTRRSRELQERHLSLVRGDL